MCVCLCVCVSACVYVCVYRKAFSYDLPVKKKKRKNFLHTVHYCLLLIIYTIKKVDVSIQCLTHFLNTISLHYEREKKLTAFP